MKKILFTLIFITITNFTNVYAEERENKLKNLFELLRDADTSGIANQVEMEIWSIWTTHPYEENLTTLLTKGSILMAENKLYEAYDVFSTVIELDPVWAEGWNIYGTEEVYIFMDSKNGTITDFTKNLVITCVGKKINNNQQGITPMFAI